MKKLNFSFSHFGLFTMVLLAFAFSAMADSGKSAISFEAPDHILVLDAYGGISSKVLSLPEDAEDDFILLKDSPTDEGFKDTRLSTASDYGAKVTNSADYVLNDAYEILPAQLEFKETAHRSLHPT